MHFKYINAKDIPFQIRHMTSYSLIQHFWFSGFKNYDYFRVFILIFKKGTFTHSPGSFSMPIPCLKELWGTALITQEQGKTAHLSLPGSWDMTGQTPNSHALGALGSQFLSNRKYFFMKTMQPKLATDLYTWHKIQANCLSWILRHT